MFLYRRAILQNDDLLAETPLTNLFTNDFWGTPLSHSGSHKSYRPLTSLTFKLNAYFHGLNPKYFHLTNVLLHSIASYLFVALAKAVFKSRRKVILSSFLFALHPIHTEAVAGIVGRADILASIFYILAFLAFEKSDMTLTILGAAASMFCKEQGVTVLGVCFVMECLKAKKGRNLAFLVLSTFGLLLLRGRLMGFNVPKFAKADNPASASDSFVERSLTLAFLPAFNFWLSVCPAQLSFDWSMDAIPLIKSWSDPRNVLSAAFYAGLLAFLWRSRKVTMKRLRMKMDKNLIFNISRFHQ